MATRQHLLTGMIHRHFARLRRGHPNTRAAERRLLLSIAQDICALSIGIRHFAQLSDKHVAALIAHWQQRGNGTATVYHKLAMLRKHYRVLAVDTVLQRCTAIRPGSTVARSDKAPNAFITLSAIENDYLRWLLAGQQCFGLMFKEALQLHPGVLCEGYVRVLRLYAFNNRARHIAIRTLAQQQWVSDFCQQADMTTRSCTVITMLRRQRRVLAGLGVPGEYFRYRYVWWRYAELLAQGLPQREIMRHLRHELGYQRTVSVNRIIEWENKRYAMPNTACIN